MKFKIKTIFSALLPFILIISAYVFFTKTSTMTEQQLDIIKLSPYVTFLIGSAIALKFNRNREFFTLIILTLCFIAINYIQANIGKAAAKDIYSIICLLIPINILIFSFLKERGVLTLWGLIRIGFIIFQLLFSYWVINPERRDILDMLNKSILPAKLSSITSMPESALIAFFITFIILVIRHIFYKSSQDIYFAGVLFALFFVLHDYENQILHPIFLTTSGIILIISIIQYSYSIAFYDELTGLPSRRALKQEMMKLGVNYSIAMLDIDFFKKFNDTYGHDTGDQVLKLVASIIKDVNGGGKSFRYGGEEFTILFPGKAVNDVLPHLEELREKIAKRGFAIRGKDRPKKKPKSRTKSSNASKLIHITVSIGAAQKNENCKTPDAVLKSADKALYRAKKKGRNCVCK